MAPPCGTTHVMFQSCFQPPAPFTPLRLAVWRRACRVEKMCVALMPMRCKQNVCQFGARGVVSYSRLGDVDQVSVYHHDLHPAGYEAAIISSSPRYYSESTHIVRAYCIHSTYPQHLARNEVRFLPCPSAVPELVLHVCLITGWMESKKKTKKQDTETRKIKTIILLFVFLTAGDQSRLAEVTVVFGCHH